MAAEFVPGQVVAELAPGVSISQINATYGTRTHERLPNSDVYLLDLPPRKSVKETVKKMDADVKRVRYAEPNFVVYPPMGGARHRAWGVSDAEPSPQEDAASALNLSIAHNISKGAGTTVAVLDTGTQLDHPALRDNFVGLNKRYDFVGDDPDPSDSPVGEDEDGDGEIDEMVGHGTHVSGIVNLVAPEAKIMPLRVLDTEGYGDSFTVAKAISYATRNGANVINLSLGSPSKSKLLQKVIKEAIKKDANRNGVLVAAAAGNSNTDAPYYPAAGGGDEPAEAEGLVAVSSVNMYGKKSDFANYGDWVDIAAPGERIRSAFPISVYAYWSGTSMATPFVSGEAALIRADDGKLNPPEVEQRIRCSARPLLATDPVYSAMLGAGHADVGASLTPGACEPNAPPRTTITAGPWGLTNTAWATFGFASSKADPAFECSLDGAPFSACTSPQAYTNLADGDHTFEVRATDAAGIIGDTSAIREWSVDTTAPSASLTAPADRATVRGTVSLSSDAADNVKMERVEFLVDGSVVATDPSAPYGFAWNTTGVPDGTKTIAARAYDAAGNQTTSTARTVFVDNTAPAAPSKPDLLATSDSGSDNTDNVTSDTTPTFEGMAEAGSTVELLADGNSLGTTSADDNGVWRFTPSTTLADGTHSITAKSTDRAGNASPASEALDVTIDTQAS